MITPSECAKIMDAVEFMNNSQGYVDLPLVAKMTGIPQIVIQNVIEPLGYKKVNSTQYMKETMGENSRKIGGET